LFICNFDHFDNLISFLVFTPLQDYGFFKKNQDFLNKKAYYFLNESKIDENKLKNIEKWAF